MACAAPQRDFSHTQIKVIPVAASVYVLQGAGGNIAASAGGHGIVLVDSGLAPLASRIDSAWKGLGVTERPIRFVINTHFHFDHVGGNAPLADSGAIVIAQDNVRTRLASGGVASNGGSVHFESEPDQSAALPVITFDRELTVHLNGEDIRAMHFPSGHTDDDTIVFFTKAKIVHMGDDYVREGFPFIDVAAGGSIDGLITACRSVVDGVPEDERIIPGHGEVSSPAELREYIAMLKGTRAAVASALRAHRSPEPMKAEDVLAEWSHRWSGAFINTEAWIDTLAYSFTHLLRTAIIGQSK